MASRILKLAFVAAMTATTSAFYVSRNLPDGTYMHYIDHHGKDVHRRIDDNDARSIALNEARHNLNSTFMEARPALEGIRRKRYNPSVGANCAGCGDGIIIPSSDTDNANAAIDGKCGDGTELVAGSDYYSKVGEAVAYVCAYMADQSCTAADRQTVSAEITSNCQAYYPGWDNTGDCYDSGAGIVYGYDHVENCFCFC